MVGLTFYLPTISIAQNIDTVCVGETNVKYKVTQTPGSTYVWQVTGGTIVNGQGTNDIVVDWGLTPGIFNISVTETNAANCIGDEALSKILIESKPNVTITGPDSICVGDEFTLQSFGAQTYLWSSGSSGNALLEKGILSKEYFVIGKNLACEADTAFKFVFAKPKPNATFNASIVDDWIKGDEILFTTSDTSISNWTWELNGNNLNQNQNGIKYRFNSIGNYTLFLTAFNKFSCADTFSINREVYERLDLYVPTAFTPNGNNLNDVFKPVGANYISYTLQIFDHLGGLIYEGVDSGWDGNYNGNLMQSANYSYKIIFTTLSGKRKAVDGNVMLVN